ncbi:MAG: isocitrate lyase/phosphoenolpyruvate mutase family protein [Gammaproteobacteria bacterium]|nr:isocitrate lyase/phosphoenolpyruvate mutase family protein [Gammaproteobacteria bacterium]
MNPQPKYKIFRDLHEHAGIFIMPNPWDAGTTRILTSLGFKALATTSAGMAHSLGLRDGTVSREQVLTHCRTIVEATDLPVSADLEKGFGDTPEDVAKTIKDAAAIGLVGCSIEDHTGQPADPIFDINLALERIQAAVEAKHNLPHDFILTARCENFLWNIPDLDDTIKRLQAFESAGADVLYAPGLYDLEIIRTVCSSVAKPVNVVMGLPGSTIGLKELADAGVKRISVGSALSRLVYGVFVQAANEMKEHGTFTFSSDAIGFSELETHFANFENSEDNSKP